MNIPCPNKMPCLDDANALGNYSSEEPDRLLFRGIHYPNAVWEDNPDIWIACLGLCVSEISQADADLCAHNNAQICQGNKMFGNVAHTCTRTCSDGQQYSMTVPANTFFATEQAQANALAVNWCERYLDQLCAHIADPTIPAPVYRFPAPKGQEECNDQFAIDTVCVDGGRGFIVPRCFVIGANKGAANAQARSLGEQLLTNNIGCLTEFGKSVCINDAVSTFIVPDRTGMFYPPLSWEVFGTVSPGITFEPMGIAMKITGSFTESGLFVFRLTLTDSRGTYTYRTYRVEVMEIDEPAVLPNADQDQAYSHVISVQHGWDPKTFAIRAGSALPDGLTLNGTTGAIEGTPTVFGTYSFWVVVTDLYGARCDKEFTLTIDPNIFNGPSGIVWIPVYNLTGGGTGIVNGSGGSLDLQVQCYDGLVVNGGDVGASCVWTCTNTTGSPLSCQISIQCVRNNPLVTAWGFNGVFFWERIAPNPAIYANNLGTVIPAGSWQYPFTIPYPIVVPIGQSTWHGVFSIDIGSQLPLPYVGGYATLQVRFTII